MHCSVQPVGSLVVWMLPSTPRLTCRAFRLGVQAGRDKRPHRCSSKPPRSKPPRSKQLLEAVTLVHCQQSSASFWVLTPKLLPVVDKLQLLVRQCSPLLAHSQLGAAQRLRQFLALAQALAARTSSSPPCFPAPSRSSD